jgi:hypothetical protein
MMGPPAAASAIAMCVLATLAGAQQGGAVGSPASAAPGDSVTIKGDVVAAAGGQPLAYATVIIEPGHRKRFADAGGAFIMGPLALGTYRLRVRQIGFGPRDTVLVLSSTTPIKPLHIALQVIALRLPTVTVEGERSPKCLSPGIPDSSVDPQLAALFTEVQKNVDRYRLLIDEYPFAFTREEWRVSRNGAGYEETVALDTVRYEVQEMEARPYKAGTVVIWQASPRGNAEQYMPLPTFGYLGDSAFQRMHCFVYVGEDTTGGDIPTIRLDFRPAAAIHTPDLEGSVYLDEDRYVVRRAVFRLTDPDRVVPPISELSVTMTFREILPLVPVFDEVRYRRPLYKDGQAAILEIDRLLRYHFERGTPGADGR